MRKTHNTSSGGPEIPDEGTTAPSSSAWSAAPDGGRPQGSVCTHTSMLTRPPDTGPSAVCPACVALGYDWVRLRRCTTCGTIGCCDSSRGQHAHAHYEATGHPIVFSLAHDESWAWCYVDEVFLIEV
ncbi:UBP-type zinc finger domain-containing protein [Streptomyces sp. NK15101]|uniref:UBP-type zinc finger domain-containing protein n=1 Tax=Streptomyces sp. NK15101 TaxID=2873261 RepID=UPI0027E11670|nr:UBP-type zinc finger domain-containing protein [Streptomyces sp. NK15101]